MLARSEPLRPQQRVDQVEQQAEGNERCERIVKNHNSFSSTLFDGVGVGNRKCEEAERDCNHQASIIDASLALDCCYNFIGVRRWAETFSDRNDHQRHPRFPIVLVATPHIGFPDGHEGNVIAIS